MAISMGAALLGSAVIDGAGSALGASATKKAANKASDTALSVARENNRLAADIYGQNKNALSPFMERGNAAGSAINALLGLGGTTTGGMGGVGTDTDYAQYVTSSPDLMTEWNRIRDEGRFDSMADYGQWHYGNYGQGEGRTVGMPQNALESGQPVQAAENAFKAYQDSSGYKFRMDQGMNALNTGYAGRGLLNSGAAQKAALQYGQNIGSAEFGNYLGYLGNQQGVGLSGASALAGVGQNYVGNVSANNNAAGTAAANAALVKGTANANMWGGIANNIGNVFGSSFGGSGGAYGIAGSGGIY